MIFARSKKYAAILSELVKDRLITKEYYSVVDGEAEGGALENLIFKDARAGKSFIVERERKGTKTARLSYKALSTVDTDKGKKTLIYVTLETGRFHQIRAQLSSRGASIVGDGKYGSRDKGARMPALYAYRLTFKLFGKRYALRALPDTAAYPWSLFDLSEI